MIRGTRGRSGVSSVAAGPSSTAGTNGQAFGLKRIRSRGRVFGRHATDGCVGCTRSHRSSEYGCERFTQGGAGRWVAVGAGGRTDQHRALYRFSLIHDWEQLTAAARRARRERGDG